MKRVIAYSLFIGALVVPIATDRIITRKLETIRIVEAMYDTPKGLQLITGALEARVAANNVRNIMWVIALLMVGAGVVILLLERMERLENRYRNGGSI